MDHRCKLTQLLLGEVKPSSIIGTGYKNPKKSASEYLRKQIANSESGAIYVDQIFIASNGCAFSTEEKARSSKIFTELLKGSKCFSNGSVVDFGVWPSSFGDGYEIYVELSK